MADTEEFIANAEEKLALMEQFAVGILEHFTQLSDSHKETNEAVHTLSKKIQELAANNEELQQLIEKILVEGLNSGGSDDEEGGGRVVTGAVDKEQVRELVEEMLQNIDFMKVFKNHTAAIFQEVQKRFIVAYPPPEEKKKKERPKVIALSVVFTSLVFISIWGIFKNIQEKPYYELFIPAGQKVFWKEANETDPRMLTLNGELLVPLASYDQKFGKFFFKSYANDGSTIKDASGKDMVYYIYDNAVKDNRVRAIKLGVPE